LHGWWEKTPFRRASLFRDHEPKCRTLDLPSLKGAMATLLLPLERSPNPDWCLCPSVAYFIEIVLPFPWCLPSVGLNSAIVQPMMYAFGDVSQPAQETTNVMEDVLIDFLTELVRLFTLTSRHADRS
jgi:hypothetical protein